MGFKSIQSKIAGVAGICLLLTAGILVGYSVFSSMVSQEHVSKRVSVLTEESSLTNLENVAQSYANAISRRLEPGLNTAAVVAEVAASAKMHDQREGGHTLDRDVFNRILKQELTHNSDLNGTYSAWEPNAFDGMDNQFRREGEGNNPQTGRFTPYWTRDTNGSIDVQALVEYDSDAAHPNGVGKGAWYQNPQKTHKETVTAPLPYIVQGKNVWLVTLSAPVMVDGKFYGVVGADYNLDFVQMLSRQVASEIYDGQADVSIISARGLVIADSEQPEMIGKALNTGDAENDKHIYGLVQAGKTSVNLNQKTNEFEVLAPISLGGSDTQWAIIIEVDRDVVLAEVEKLVHEMQQQTRSATLWQTVIGLAVAIVAIFLLVWMARKIARPILRSVEMAESIAQGHFDQRLHHQSDDETGQLAAALDNMADSLQRHVKVAERISQGDLNQEVVLASDTDQLGRALQQMVGDLNRLVGQIKERSEIIGANANEVSALSHDLASGATESAASVTEISSTVSQMADKIRAGADGANRARELSEESMATAEQGHQLMIDLQKAMNDIESSGKDINDIIRTIEEIAEQTNLLALNAAIEAARAGQHGRGFSVVADEVRQLAARSTEAVQQTSALIDKSARRTQRGIKLSQDTAAALDAIVERARESSSLVASIADESVEQVSGADQVNEGIQQIDEVVHGNSVSSERCASSANTLTEQSTQLTQLIQQFRLKR